MRQGETGLGGDGAVIGRQRARVEGQRPLAGGDIGVSRRGRRRGQREAETVCQHWKRSSRPMWEYLPAPRAAASDLATASRSSSRGVAYCDKQRRRARGVVPLIGYVDRFSARTGERIAVKVSSRLADPYRADLVRIVHGDANPAGPGLKFEEVEATF